MKRLVKPSVVKGTVQAPASKSVAQRAIALASMANGQSTIYNAGTSDDCLAAIEVSKRLGASINGDGKKLIINGNLAAPTQELNCGESGLGIRMFSAIASTFQVEVTLTGEGTLVNRPMDMVIDGLQQLGVTCIMNKGKLPITVQGPIRGGTARIDGSQSSQALTGLLIAAPLAISKVTIHVENLTSRPYVDLTLAMMKDFGITIQHLPNDTFVIPAGQQYVARDYNVEGDWSGAAFLLVAGAIAGEVKVTNLNSRSLQADRVIFDALLQAGAFLSIRDDSIFVKKANLKAFDFDARNCPDLFPPLVALAASCNGQSRILGVNRLKVKESDRATTLQQEFAKLGVTIDIDGDTMIVEGGQIRSGTTHSHGDHRIAMACAVAALNAEKVVEIEGAEAVNKSYPAFFDDLLHIQVEKLL